MRITRQTVHTWLRRLVQFIFNPRFLLCFGLAWLITNGWSYILLFIGSYFQIAWMSGIAGAYLAFLWLPISPEKIVTVSLSMVLLKIFFPKDEKTLGVLRALYADAKQGILTRRERRKNKKKQNRDGSPM